MERRISRINCHANHCHPLSKTRDGQARARSCQRVSTSAFNDAIVDCSDYDCSFESDSTIGSMLLTERAGLSTRIRACHSRTLSDIHGETLQTDRNITRHRPAVTAGRPLTSRGLGDARETRTRAQDGAHGGDIYKAAALFRSPHSRATRRSRRSFSSRSQQVADRARDREEE